MSGVLLRERGVLGGDGTSGMSFRLLGLLRVRHAGQVLDPGPPKQQALLAVLLLRPGLETGVEQLVESLWGEESPAYAKNLIQKSVSGLRGLGVRLEWAGGGYLLDVGGADVDLYTYERLAAAGLAAVRAGELVEAARLLEEARTMSTGPLGEGLEGPMLERERLYRQERFLAEMEVRAELELELGRHRNAVPYLQYAVHKYPLRERFLWLLMLALHRSDRGNEALTLYAAQRGRVVEELGVEPGPALRTLQERLLLQDPELMVMPVLRQDG
ncbi:AfsR/SARP family transcriptional regulator [Streptomyces sp. NBC_01294]|uniref:AfsR/SARP family transcriptional regulator n=1 Tax=Streptomyces sp. NBC_01294 TaxID=2903815 RepID=UPI002DDA2F00|nr:AfsR/SARP family transcriptional regulator [Streptomyces sp. NBC_01294]WRZ56265.1 AfsR/SARP family transcriptional regulator [Streptomyces sp. NBC_01294]